MNVFRVAPDGTTEIRLQSHRNAVDYAAEAENVFGKLTGITDRLKYDDLSLAKARRYMIENRKTLSPYVRYGLGLMRTKKGAPITFAAANWTENMFGGEDLEAEATMTTLLAQGGGRSKCDTVNCTWLKQPNGAGPSSDMHVFIGGGSNELHIVPQCDRETIFMFSAKSSVTPSEQNPMRRQLIDVFRQSDQGDIFTLDDLTERLQSTRREAIAFLLGDLASQRIIDQFVTVVSPLSQGGIERFPDLDQVPSDIYDPFQMRQIEVVPDLIRIYFTRHQEMSSEHETLSGGAGEGW